MSTQNQIIGRYGGLKSWANTPDRTARTRNARAKSPGSVEYWLAKLDPERFAKSTKADKLAAAEAAKNAYFAGLALKSAKARREAS